MSAPPVSKRIEFRWLWLLLAALCASGTWAYVARVLIPYQVADAAAHGRPRGNLSDLYPRWWGARELLLHGRDPYGAEVSREIQEGYYGHRLDPARPADPKDQQKFAYPVYVVFFLAPTIHQPFAAVRQEAVWVLLACTIATVLVWLRILRWALSSVTQLAIVILTLGSLPLVQGLKLQQMTLFVAGLVGFAIWLLAANRPIAAGAVLAVATIKPQLVGILLLWLLLWTFADWRRRIRWLPSFVLTLAALFALSEHVLPHWVPRFLQALRDYQNYSDSVSGMAKLLPGLWSLPPLLAIAAAAAYVGWKNRHDSAATLEFARMASLVLAVTVIMIPSYALYNQVLLLPAVLGLARDAGALWQGGAIRRGLLLLVGALLIWPWLTALLLAAGSFVLPPGAAQRAWALPFWSVLLCPIAVAGLVLLAQFSQAFAAPEKPVTS